jgi:LPPG:FO 2-phospho-L-lactate transferase
MAPARRGHDVTDDRDIRVVALAGGVGGAKLADGLMMLLGARLAVVVNTGDDFVHLGLHVSPDLDTVMYTLAGIANPHTGWGIAGETWNFMAQIERLGGPSWFRLGDRDLATHAMRTQRLAAGATLTAITVELCTALQIAAAIIPMSDAPVRTMIRSGDIELPFQDYFVRRACADPVTSIRYDGVEAAAPSPALAAIGNLDAVVIAPSNPYLSIDPILVIPGMRRWLSSRRTPVVAVSPIVAGAAVKGPAAKIMQELGVPATAAAVAKHYRGLIDGLVIDDADAGLRQEIEAAGIAVRVAPAIMRNAAERAALARLCLAFARDLADERRA